MKARNFRRKKEFRNILVPSPFILHTRKLWPRENELLRVAELVYTFQDREKTLAFLPFDLRVLLLCYTASCVLCACTLSGTKRLG